MKSSMSVMILGTVQDGGYPHIGCRKKCCKSAWLNQYNKRFIASIAILDSDLKECWIIDSSPDIKNQLNMIMNFMEIDSLPKIRGIFLTHAHTGHYSGLLDLGKEAMNADNIPVYSMPDMARFISSNNPFKFLISSNNIHIKEISDNQKIELSNGVIISPFKVPHRNELSETVGYRIYSDSKSIIYIPDIDSWDQWEKDIIDVIKNNDYLFLDGTFYNCEEINNRNISEIPHPFIKDSLIKFEVLDKYNRNKIFFTHFNHTNIMLRNNNKLKQSLISDGYNIANEGEFFYI